MPTAVAASALASAGGAPRRRGRPGHDLTSVLNASVAVFIERGFDGTSMEDLSQRLGISKSAIYHHVESKDALLGLALDHALTALESAAAQTRGLQGSAVVRLETLLRRSVEVLVDRLPYVTLLLRVRGNSEVERDALARRRRIDRFGADLVTQAIAEGDLRPDLDPAVTARLLFGLVNSLTEWLKPDGRHDPTPLGEAIVTMAFAGIRA
ncbi:TetR/AcrR family transcriptional regulator [Jatrophihabitans telluris]|uniref:TetR/AcrR family transcriptional regulator n=1 Tax=Jatrophihabitans telluris TaxID=2038343 RepID=UPI0032215BFF